MFCFDESCIQFYDMMIEWLLSSGTGIVCFVVTSKKRFDNLFTDDTMLGQICI